MIATIDKAGRLVIPKSIRDAMGLRPGSSLKVDFVDGKIEIDYAPVEWRLRIHEDGLPILETDAALPELTDEIIHETREAIYREREARWM